MITAHSVKLTGIALGAWVLMAAPSLAEPLTVHGVNPRMSYERVLGTLQRRSQHCNAPEERVLSDLRGGHTRSYVDCWSDNVDLDEKPDITIEATDTGKFVSVIFRCTATKTCGLSISGVVRQLINANILPEHVEINMRPSDVTLYHADANGDALLLMQSIRRTSIQLIANESRYADFDF